MHLSGKLHTGFDLLRKEADKLNLRLENLKEMLKSGRMEKKDVRKSRSKSRDRKKKRDRTRSRSNRKRRFFFLFLVEVIKKPKNKIKTEMTKNIN